jgi:putative heme-binding domain-containing protein
MLLEVSDDKDLELEIRRTAVRAIRYYPQLAAELLAREEEGRLESALRESLALASLASESEDVRRRAAELFPPRPSRNNQPMPPLDSLTERRGDAQRGSQVYRNQGKCITCHRIGEEGTQVGPDLSQIGNKLERQALYESILYPSAGINYNYETYSVLLDNGLTVSGMITSRTDEEVVLTTDEGVVHRFPQSSIDEIDQLSVSLMPADLQTLLTPEELVDLVEYLLTLRQNEDVRPEG